jgi:hypothetical protein
MCSWLWWSSYRWSSETCIPSSVQTEAHRPWIELDVSRIWDSGGSWNMFYGILTCYTDQCWQFVPFGINSLPPIFHLFFRNPIWFAICTSIFSKLFKNMYTVACRRVLSSAPL